MTGLPPALASRQRRSIIEDASSGLGMSRGPHISIRGNRFRLIDAAGNELLVPTAYLDLIVIDANAKTSKVFFEGEYDPSGANDVPPTCFSDNGTGPSTQSMSPQSPTCAVCPWNRVGSDQSKVTGKGIKACSDRKKVGVIIPDDPAVNVYEFQITPGSLTNFKAYAKWIGTQASGQPGRALDIADLVTRAEFDPNKMGVLKFSAVAFADDDRMMKLIEYIDANKLSDASVGRLDVAHDPEGVKAMLAGQPAAALPPPAAQPAPEQPFALPPRQTQPAALAPPAAQPGIPPAAPAAPRQRRPRQPATPPAAPPAAAPFMAPAAAPQPQPPMASPGDLAIPAFLQRGNGAQPPAPPAARFGMVDAPPPPPGVADALADAMSLPTRR